MSDPDTIRYIEGLKTEIDQLRSIVSISNAIPVDYSATSTIVGWSSFITKYLTYQAHGRKITVWFFLYGTSNATTVSFTVPYNAAAGTTFQMPVRCSDNNDGTVAWGYLNLVGGSNVVNVHPSINAAANAWTASNPKYIVGQFEYYTD